MNTKYIFLILLSISLLASSAYRFIPESNENWPEYLGGPSRNHYSGLSQINVQNADKLQIAWKYNLPDSGQIQANPLIIDGILYGVSSTVQPFALDAATGKEIWRFGDSKKYWAYTSRGVSYWERGQDKRILFTAGSHLWALNAKTGKPISSFGSGGKVDLHLGLPPSAKDKFVISNTPGTIYQDLIIMPTRVAEEQMAAPGYIRAYNILTGKLAWVFHTIPHPGEFGYETFPKDAYKNPEIGGANSWAGMAIDRELGIVFAPTGSTSYDFYGANRKGANLYANCMLALDARTGKRKWHYQFIHHDVWDRDAPAPPNLVEINHEGKKIKAVAQITKQGYVFVWDRLTGKPVFDIHEITVPASDLAGEHTWPTQPIPSKPSPFGRQAYQLTESDLNDKSENYTEILDQFRKSKRGLFDPPSMQGTLILPGIDGGAEWGGAAVSPQGIMYFNSNEMPWICTMEKVQKMKNETPGERVYGAYCMSCHGKDRAGKPLAGYPSLVGIEKRYNSAKLLEIIQQGRGMMPGFGHVSRDEQNAIVTYLMGHESKNPRAIATSQTKPLAYKMKGYERFVDKQGLPAIKPPYGLLHALDLNTGEYLWKIPLGNEPLLESQGIKGTGSENYGGPIITKSGLLIIAGTKDAKLRIFEAKTAKLLYEYSLPAAAFATPSTYSVNGKQYIVIACGGTKLGTTKGHQYVAFGL
ncbi:MAG: PQQ-binding-like beta-propeller repeat protein [Leadbetterella sp.]